MKKFGNLINTKNLTFGKETELKTILGLTPGSVSPLGLLNDQNGIVKLYIDKEIWYSNIVNFHPNINTESLEFKKEDFHKLIKILHQNPVIIELDP